MDQQPGRVSRVDLRAELDTDAELDETEVTQIEIEQTRAEMSETLEAIKEKLNPQMLMQQAKDTVHGVTADLAQQAKDTVHGVTADLAQRAKDTVHGVTADLVQQARENLPQMTSNAAHQAVSGAVAEAKEAVGDAVHTARDAGSSLMEMIERNPLPAALLATGLGWVWLSGRRQRDEGSVIERNPLPAAMLATSAGWLWMNARQQNGERSSWDRGYEYQNSRGGETSRREGESSGVGAAVGQTLRAAQDKVGAAADQVQQQVGQIGAQVQDKVGAVADRVQQHAGQIGAQVQDRAHRTVDGFQRLLEQHPLSVAAIAVGLGAAVGLAIPETRREQQLMGETRDRLGEKVQHTAQELGLKAQIVVEEALGAVKEEAKNQGLTK